jgi:hypothetical protein
MPALLCRASCALRYNRIDDSRSERASDRVDRAVRPSSDDEPAARARAPRGPVGLLGGRRLGQDAKRALVGTILATWLIAALALTVLCPDGFLQLLEAP